MKRSPGFVGQILVVMAGCLVVLDCVAKAEVEAEVAVSAAQDATRLLAVHCLECHSGLEPKGELDLSTRAGVLTGGESGPAIVSGDSGKSLLWKQIAEDEMPPKKKLGDGDKEILRRWIEGGASYPREPIDLFRFTAGQRAGYDWWALQPVDRPTPPVPGAADRARTPIDAFVLKRLEANGLAPAPPAEPEVLIRRLHYDLTGLPPSPGEVHAFVAAFARDRRSAIDSAADALLNSPHHGERWARHWLDVSRYGESNGFEYDQLRPNAWRFRDWVIAALNEDMPYDRFARLQIAGDVMEPDNPDAIVATSFLVCGAFDGLIPQGDKQRKIMREDEMEDLVGTVAQTFLGLTVHCARCHDHKFDPIRQREYFQMASALGGVRRGDRTLPPDPVAVALSDRIEELTRKLGDLERPIREEILSELDRNTSVEGATRAPDPVARWTFDSGFEDEVGGLHAVPKGGARLENGALRLDGKKAHAATAPLSRSLSEKTLEAWVRLENLGQRGGGVIGVQATDGGLFDAIVYGEREPGKWMAGSNGFSRTGSFEGEPETAGDGLTDGIHVAIVYDRDGTITGYRNGLIYGKPYKSAGLATFPAGTSQVIFGLRHGTEAASGRMLAGWIDRAQLYDRALSPDEVAASARVAFVGEDQIVARLSPEWKQARAEWKEEIGRLTVALQAARKRTAFAVTPVSAPVGRLLVRGSPFQPADVVSPGGVAAVGVAPDGFGLPPDAPESDRRTALARWVTHPDNPLFARVMVNRIWHYHFGQGLVKAPNDFGYNGGYPSHPELLDWLAAEFRAADWSMKAIHRLIVTSAVYQQSSTPNPAAFRVDSGNRLLWRRTPARLEAETLRDAILTVAGQLNPAMGGPGFRDFDMRNHKGSWVYDPIDPEGVEFNRRSVYRTWARGSKHPLLSTFDCPDPSATAPVRGVTTTPLGALSLMNTSFVLRMADHFAERLQREAGDDVSEQIRLAFRLSFGREPRPTERSMTRAFVETNGLPALCRVLFNANEFLYVL